LSILPQLKRRHAKEGAFFAREVSESEFIPYKGHFDKNTIITKNNELLQVIKLDGYSFETADDEDVDMKKSVRNTLFKSIASGNFAVWFHLIRKRHGVFPTSTFPPGFGNYVNEKWKRKHHSKDSFWNELYITIVRKADTRGIMMKVEHQLRGLVEAVDKKSFEASLIEAHKELSENAYRVVATLKEYGARTLTTRETAYGTFSEPLEFLAKLVNCGDAMAVPVPTTDASKILPTHRIYFGPRAMEFRGPTQRKYAACMGIKEYASATAAGMFDSFLQLPFEMILSQSFEFGNRQIAVEGMQREQRKMMNAEDAALSQVAEISDALDLAVSGHVAFGKHNLVVTAFEDTLPALEEAMSMVSSELTNLGMNAKRETIVMEQAFWSMLPANLSFSTRPATINTMNLASLVSMHNYPVGQPTGNHWGDAVTVFDTASGTPFFFNFHVRDVGHTAIIGPTGAGKTVLMNFLAAQAQKFRCRTFFFDKDRGAEIFIRAFGGKYTILQPGENCGFNPLQLPKNSENISFISEWMKALATAHGESYGSEEAEMVAESIRGNYKLRKEDRILRNIAPFYGLEGPGKLASRLRMWHTNGQYAGLFDNPMDTLDFSQNTVFGFEMGEVMADKVSLGPILLYLFHRISQSLDGTPTLIVLDEAWALIDNPIFGPRIKDWLKTLRKLNAMVILATQSVEDASKSNISDTILQQTATQIFLPNPKATDAYRTSFMLSDRELNLLKTTDPGTRFFLVKQSNNVVIARIDLSGMDDVIAVLSGRAESVAILNGVLAEYGDDPKIWLPVFWQRVKSASKN